MQDLQRYAVIPSTCAILFTAIFHFARSSRSAGQRLDNRNRAMRVVLNHVDQGLVVVEPDGRVHLERSEAADRWLGRPEESAALVDVVRRYDAAFADSLALGLTQLAEDGLAAELLFEQLPKRIRAGDLVLDVSYKPINGPGPAGRILVVFTDMTVALKRARADETPREIVALATRALADRAVLRSGLDEARELVRRLVDVAARSDGADVVARDVHTLKGNCALLGLASIARLCHEIENERETAGEPSAPASFATVAERFEEVTAPVLTLLVDGVGPQVSPDDVARLRTLVAAGADAESILAELDGWSHEPIAHRLSFLADQACSLARRLGRGDNEGRVEAAGARNAALGTTVVLARSCRAQRCRPGHRGARRALGCG